MVVFVFNVLRFSDALRLLDASGAGVEGSLGDVLHGTLLDTSTIL